MKKNQSRDLEIGTRMADGSIYAGLTNDGRSQIFALPTDLHATKFFNEAAKAVQRLNNLKCHGHDDWQIPSLDVLAVLQTNVNEGNLKGTFNTTLSSRSDRVVDWYWSSTKRCADQTLVWVVRFPDGDVDSCRKNDARLSCRPVRLVSVYAPGGKAGRK